MGFDHQEEEQQRQSKDGARDCFVAIDMGNLQPIEATNYGPRIKMKMQKVLSRKGSQRLGAADVNINTGAQFLGNSRFAPEEIELSGPGRVVEIVTDAGDGGDVRRRRAGKDTWTRLDPRRVLLFFATISSMGTLILLYFTLSLRQFNVDDSN